MQRNNDLLRAILLYVEKYDGNRPFSISTSQFEKLSPELTDDILEYHIQLLVKHKLLEAVPTQFQWLMMDLTWEGHDFLTNAKDESIWQKAKQAAGNLSLDVFSTIIKEIALAVAKSRISL